MHSGPTLHSGAVAPGLDAQYQFSSSNRSFPDIKFSNNFVQNTFEEPQQTVSQPFNMPQFFLPTDNQSMNFKNSYQNQGFSNSNVGSGYPGGTPDKMAVFPNGNQHSGNSKLYYNSNPYLKNGNVSRTSSLNNISHDSKNTSRQDLNNSRRNNNSSRSNNKGHKNYQVAINDDINLIERIEVILNQISMNHNKSCPFCCKIIDIKRCNFQNISAFFSGTSKKYYLTHFDCYLKSNSSSIGQKIYSLASVIDSKINYQNNPLPNLETSSFLRNGKQAYFVQIEGYHPISSFLLFKVERIYQSLEHVSHKNQLLYVNFASKSTSLFDPTSYAIPHGEFRLVLTIHLSHSTEDPYTFEFLMDFSQVKFANNQKSKFAEAFYLQGGNNIILGSEILFDSSNEIPLDASFQSSNSVSQQAKPEFGKNVFVVLNHLSMSLPLKRVETRIRQIPSMTSLDDSICYSQQSTNTRPSTAKHTQSSIGHNQNQFKQPVPQQMFFQPAQNCFINDSGSSLNSNSNPVFNEALRIHTGTNYFNQPLFPQFDKAGEDSFLAKDEFDAFSEISSGHDNEAIPPGILSFFSPTEHHSSAKGSRNLYVETKTQPKQDSNSFIKEEDETVDTPEKITSLKIDTTPPATIERTKTKCGQSLYTAVLSGRFKSDSLINSPTLHKIHKQYFSEISSPCSGRGTPDLSTPKNRRVDYAENGDHAEGVDDMVEGFRLEDYQGRVVEFAKTFNGSRILQKFFPRANQLDIEIFIGEIEDDVESLMLDSYANYMFQTLAQSCSPDQRYHLLQKIAPVMIRIACDKKGTHSLQSIISLMSLEKEEKLIRETFQDHILELTFNENGTHFIQKLIKAVSIEGIEFIYRPIVSSFVQVANHHSGLCVLKQLITKIEKTDNEKREILNCLNTNFQELVQNPYGNYAIQHAFEIFREDCEPLFEKATERLVQFSNQKFSSNVVEKCLSFGNQETKKKFAKEILKNDKIIELLKNKYGNFVLLKMMSTFETEDKVAVFHAIMKNVNSMSNSKYKSHWLRFIDENPLKIPVQSGKPHRTSQFKSSATTYDTLSRGSTSDLNSPMTADEWKNLRQAEMRPANEIQEERSQFYNEAQRRQRGQNMQKMNFSDDYLWDNRFSHYNERSWEDVMYHNGYVNNNNFENEGKLCKKPQMANPIFVKDQVQTPNKKGKNFNQKFYVEKSQQQNNNKWGYNHFY